MVCGAYQQLLCAWSAMMNHLALSTTASSVFDLIFKDLHVSLRFLLMVQTSLILYNKETTKMAAWLSLLANKASFSPGCQ